MPEPKPDPLDLWRGIDDAVLREARRREASLAKAARMKAAAAWADGKAPARSAVPVSETLELA